MLKPSIKWFLRKLKNCGYEEKNRDLIARIAAQPPKPGEEAIRAKLQAAKAKREAKS